MSIQIRYFASLKETVGRSQEQISVARGATVQDVWALANPDRELPENTVAAINMEYTSMETVVNDGDEVAFFPPVTGG